MMLRLPRCENCRMTLLTSLVLAALISAAAGGLAPGAEPERPNVVYIMSDELAYYEVSYMGNPLIKTPNIDRMAQQGIRFTQALAGCSVCAPLRCTLMTGKHMGHCSVRKNDGGTPLRAGEETIASMLRRAGYATGGFGKWGCGGRGSTGVPEKHGFDVFLGYYDQVHAHSFYPPYIVRNSEEVPLPGNRGGRSGETYSHYVIMDGALKFIRASRDRPFFCYLPITPPHGMYDIPEDDPAYLLYADKDWPEEAKRYAGMVTMVDRNVGEVLALLKELGLEEKTIVFFTGDNGGQDRFRDKDHPRGFFGPNVNPVTGQEFRGGKGNLYEGGLRIPFVVRWPGKIEPGRVSDLLCYQPDMFPTLAEITGAKPPDDLDGISIVPELLGEEAAGRKQPQHEYLYWEYGRQTAVRMGDWKAIRPLPDAAWELYDLSKDLSEEHDVAADHPDVLEKMKAHAAEAHEPVEEGVFFDRAIHERDRRAKYGDSRAAVDVPLEKCRTLPPEGLIPNKGWKIARVSSESRANGKLAKNAIDGDPRTHWHSEFQSELHRHPHELVIDLGAEHTIRGFRYLARQDSGWNGAVAACEFYVADSPEAFGQPAASTTFRKTKEAQEAKCDPVRGRYVMLKVLSEVGGNPWASVSELGVVGE